jgi:hypothetical protein
MPCRKCKDAHAVVAALKNERAVYRVDEDEHGDCIDDDASTNFRDLLLKEKRARRARREVVKVEPREIAQGLLHEMNRALAAYEAVHTMTVPAPIWIAIRKSSEPTHRHACAREGRAGRPCGARPRC